MKKGQALLVFFALQLVSIMIFFIVLISLLSMTQHVKFTIREFDENTAYLLATRRIVSSADCLAYEDREIIVNLESQQLKFVSRVFPNIIDKNKVIDYEHINCMRKDNYDLKADVAEGVWDAAKGTGAAFKYDIAVVDLSGETPQFVTGLTNPTTIKEGIVTSLLGRINKKLVPCKVNYKNRGNIAGCNLDYHAMCGCDYSWNANGCVDDEGNTYGCYVSDICKSTTAYPYTQSCKKGDCYVDNYDDHPPNLFSGACVIEDNKSDPGGILPIWKVYEPLYVFEGTVAANTSKENYQIGIWNQLDTTCFDASSVKRTIIPISIYDNGELKPGVLLIQTCLLEGENHQGMTLPEIEFKAKYVKK